MKYPLPVYDAYAIVKNVLEQVETLKLDKDKIVLMGESAAAGLIIAVAQEMIKRDEIHLIRLLMPISIFDSSFVDGTLPHDKMTKPEQNWYMLLETALRFCSVDYERQKQTDTYLYPNLMSNEVCAKLPRTIVMTTEFDCYRRSSANIAEKIHQNGKLVDFVCHPGLNHVGAFHTKDDTVFQLNFWQDIALLISEHI